tara:strand:- start:1418 stop:1612 length:195 start_codon:yes stop_codon:yes gene_type:complete
MFIDIPTIVIVVLIGITAWQQFSIKLLEEDMDDIMDKHNDFVEAMDKVFQGILIAAEEKDDDQR